MVGYYSHIEKDTENNTNFRKVVFSGKYSQLVLMSLLPNEEIGMEVHEATDQFFRVEIGNGKVIMNGEEQMFEAGDAFIVPAGTQHNILNLSNTESLRLYTIYSPAHHKDATVHVTKADALADEEDHI